MKLTAAPGYAIRVATPPTSDQLPLSELIVNGVPSGKIYEGAILEAALTWGERLLLFISDDIPYEDGLRIYLLDRHLNILDQAILVAMYSTGIFSDLDITEDDKVHFRFFADTIWTLTLLPRPAFALPFFTGHYGAWRPGTWKRWFRIGAMPTPQAEPPPPSGLATS